MSGSEENRIFFNVLGFFWEVGLVALFLFFFSVSSL